MDQDLTVRATVKGVFEKGFITSAKTAPREYGNAVVLPDFIRLRVLDIDYEDIEYCLASLTETFDIKEDDTYFELVPTGLTNMSLERSEAVRDFLVNNFGVPTSDIVVVESSLKMPKEIFAKEIFENEIIDKMAVTLKPKRYKIKESVIDSWVENSIQNIELTLSEFNSIIEDVVI